MKCPGCGGRELEPDGDGLLRCNACGEIIDGGPEWGSFAAVPTKASRQRTDESVAAASTALQMSVAIGRRASAAAS